MNTVTQPSNRKFYLLVAAFLLAAVLVGVFSARRGVSSLEKWKDEMRAKGEKFTVAELLPKRTGPTTNRLADLVQTGRVLPELGSAATGIDHFRYLSNGVAEAAWMRPRLGLHKPFPRSASSSTPLAPGMQIVPPPGFGPGLPSSPPAYEWEDLAAELATVERILEDAHALLRVPDRDTGWNYDNSTAMPRCFVEKRRLAQWLAAANTHALHERQPELAMAHLTASCNLVAWHGEDFTIVGQMIRVAIGGMALQSTWATMQAPGLTEAQLAGLQTQWQGLDFLPAFARALEFERASIGQLFTRIRSGQESVVSAFGSGATGVGKVADGAAGIAWRAFGAEADEQFYLRFMQGQIDAMRKLARLRSWAATQPDLAANAARLTVLDTWQGKLMLLSEVGIPNLGKAFQTAVRYETRRELTIAALAVERFRRKHGKPPASLTEVVPGFVSAVPVGWMDGKPLRYRANADGTFTLWSIGEDLKDDGGDGSDAVPGTRTGDIWERRDVVWPHPPR